MAQNFVRIAEKYQESMLIIMFKHLYALLCNIETSIFCTRFVMQSMIYASPSMKYGLNTVSIHIITWTI